VAFSFYCRFIGFFILRGLGLGLLEELQENFCGLGIGQVLAGFEQRSDGGVKLADTEQVITEEKLEVGVEGVKVGLFGKPVNVVEERIVVRVQAARIEDGLLIR